jgi:hypothetical protein
MRQVLSWRFVAAVLAVVAMGLGVYIIATREGGSGRAAAGDDDVRRMDFISLVASTRAENFAMTGAGTVSGDLTLVMPNGQNVTVFPGTPGVVECENLAEPYQCAVLGQSLGDSIVWFALVPMRGGEFRFELPAIVDLDDGFARLVNGWEVPYAQVIDRTACDPDAASFSEFLDEHGTEFVSIFDLTERAIVAVAC